MGQGERLEVNQVGGNLSTDPLLLVQEETSVFPGHAGSGSWLGRQGPHAWSAGAGHNQPWHRLGHMPSPAVPRTGPLLICTRMPCESARLWIDFFSLTDFIF